MTHRKPLLWGGFEGQATDIEIHAREVIALKRRIEEIIANTPASRSKRSPKTWSATTS